MLLMVSSLLINEVITTSSMNGSLVIQCEVLISCMMLVLFLCCVVVIWIVLVINMMDVISMISVMMIENQWVLLRMLSSVLIVSIWFCIVPMLGSLWYLLLNVLQFLWMLCSLIVNDVGRMLGFRQWVMFGCCFLFSLNASVLLMYFVDFIIGLLLSVVRIMDVLVVVVGWVQGVWYCVVYRQIEMLILFLQVCLNLLILVFARIVVLMKLSVMEVLSMSAIVIVVLW